MKGFHTEKRVEQAVVLLIDYLRYLSLASFGRTCWIMLGMFEENTRFSYREMIERSN